MRLEFLDVEMKVQALYRLFLTPTYLLYGISEIYYSPWP